MGIPHKQVKEQSARRQPWQKPKVEPLPVHEDRPVTRYRVLAVGDEWGVFREMGGDRRINLSTWPTHSDACVEIVRLSGLVRT